MSYSKGIRIPGIYSGKEAFIARSKERKQQRKTKTLTLESLISAYKTMDHDRDFAPNTFFLNKVLFKRALRQIRSGNYTPKRPKNLTISKPSGGFRELNIPYWVDRVVAKAVLTELTSVVDPKFDHRSHGGRPNMGTESAIAMAYKAIAAGMNYVIACDVKDAFPNTPTESAICILEKLAGAHSCMELAKVCIRGHKGHKRVLGLDQGNPLSPIAFNAYMHEWVDLIVPNEPEIQFIRYLDNIYLFSKDPDLIKDQALAVQKLLAANGLILKIDPIKDLCIEKIKILGYQIGIAENKIIMSSDESDMLHLASLIEEAYEKPNPQLRAKLIVDSWLESKGLSDSWSLEHTLRVNQILNHYGIDLQIHHEDTQTRFKDLKTNWAFKYQIPGQA